LYKRLKKDSLENAVDALWNNILRLYFKLEYGYMVEPQASPGGKSKKKVDYAVQYVHNGVPRRVVLIENKRVSNESSDATWADAMEQLVEYMLEARAANRQQRMATIYGIITVGHYSRYYTLSGNATTLSDFSSSYMHYNGEPLHFKHHEYEMHTLLTELVELTCQ
jgi:hypothetical protein